MANTGREDEGQGLAHCSAITSSRGYPERNLSAYRRGKFVFPSPRTGTRPMSSNCVLSALRRMGYAKDEMSGHGFRSMASTLLNEQGWNRDAIERQLAHAERNSVRAAYNYAEFMPERKKMMQAWADYLEGIKAVAKIIPIRAVR
jgi:integrase